LSKTSFQVFIWGFPTLDPRLCPLVKYPSILTYHGVQTFYSGFINVSASLTSAPLLGTGLTLIWRVMYSPWFSPCQLSLLKRVPSPQGIGTPHGFPTVKLTLWWLSRFAKWRTIWFSLHYSPTATTLIM